MDEIATWTLREELAVMAGLFEKLGHGRSLYGVVAEHGREWKWSPRPADVNPGKLGECFGNAAALALFDDDSRYVYCEGYALTALPVHHAWVLDTRTGEIIDPTWRSAEQDTDCGHCDGGVLYAEDDEGWVEQEEDCPHCDGTGQSKTPHFERTATEYVGVPFDTAWLREWILRHKVWGVFDKAEAMTGTLIPGDQPGTFKVASGPEGS